MTIFEYNRPRAGLFYSLLKMDKKVRTNALIVIMVGVFLLPKTAHLSTITEEKIIELTNIERSSAGLAPLSNNSLLHEAAVAKAAAILSAGEFDHELDGRRFSSWVKESGYEYSIVGENLAIDFVTSEGVLKAWRNSPSHLKNILGERYQDIGVAVTEGIYQGQQTIIVAQIFGSPFEAPDQKEQATATSPKKEKNPLHSLLSWLAISFLDNRLPLPILAMVNNGQGLGTLTLANDDFSGKF